MDRLAFSATSRMSPVIGVVAALCLLGAVFVWGSGSAPAADPPEPTQLVANINDDCIEGEQWVASHRVNVRVRDGSDAVVFATTVSTNSAGRFIVNNVEGQRCDIPVDLRPGMKVTASDGIDTTKVLVLEKVTYDQLDPVTDTAAGTAPPGRSVYVNLSPPVPAEATVVASESGDWFVDFRTAGGAPPDDVGPGDVRPGSMGDAWLADDDFDSTVADHFVTTVSLSTGFPAGAAPPASAGAAGTTVVRRGSRVRLSGRLSAGTSACVRRKRVKLLNVTGRRSKALRSTRTNRTGQYSFIRKVRRTTSFRVRYAGNRRCQRSKSRVRVVRVAGS